MPKRININKVRVGYLGREFPDCKDHYGLFIWKDAERFQLLDFQKEADIPSTLEAILKYCLQGGYTKAWDLFVQNTAAGQCVVFDDAYYDVDDVRRLMDAVEKEHKETLKEN